MKEIRLFSPAKVNLFLELLEKRQDGYWEIETVLQEIDLKDEVIIRERGKGEIRVKCSNLEVGREEDNLAYKAARIISSEYAAGRQEIEIELKKNIPVGRGLGGGSSNAATVLKGLNQLWELKLSPAQLAKIGMNLGMDVPFFIYGGICLGKVRGEMITPLPYPANFSILLLWPDFPILTAQVYKGVSPHLTYEPQSVTVLRKALEAKDLERVQNNLFNRLEEVVQKICPSITHTQEKINSLRLGRSIMSGSGPTFFVLFSDNYLEEERIRLELSTFQGGYYVGKTS